MAPKGGYSRNRARGVEYVPVQDTLDAEGKLMARDMGQAYPVWVADAIAHHLYRCELMVCEERFRADTAKFEQGNTAGAPIREDEKYQPARPKPTITRTAEPAGQGGGPERSRSHRPR